jgi:hypothetical protein
VRTIFDSAITTETAEVYTTEIKTDSECYILRDEIVIPSSAEGVYNYLVNEGEKLSFKHPIADVYSSEHDLEIQNRIREINERIAVLENSSVEKSYQRTNISKLDSEINGFTMMLHEATSNGEYSLVVQNKNDFLTLMNKRNLVVKSELGYKDVIEALESEKKKLTSSLSSPLMTVVAPESGYFYSSVDGLEKNLNSSILNKMTVDSFFDLLQKATDSQSLSVVGKIVTSFEWYTLCIVDKNEAVLYNSGDYYELVYPYSTGLSLNSLLLSKVSQADRNEVILVFKNDKIPEKFNFLRRQKTQIIRSDYTGLKVSKEALRIVDGYEGVYVLIGNVINFKRCDKICESDGYYLISLSDPLENENTQYSYLQMYDSVIVEGKELYHGKMIG